MGFDPRSQVRVPGSVLVRTLDDEVVILNLSNERYYGLDEVGARVWHLLITQDSVAAAFEELTETYRDVAPEVLRRDMEALLSELVDEGLLEIDAV